MLLSIDQEPLVAMKIALGAKQGLDPRQGQALQGNELCKVHEQLRGWTLFVG